MSKRYIHRKTRSNEEVETRVLMLETRKAKILEDLKDERNDLTGLSGDLNRVTEKLKEWNWYFSSDEED